MFNSPLKIRYIALIIGIPYLFPSYLYYPEYYLGKFGLEWYWLDVISYFPYYVIVLFFIVWFIYTTASSFFKLVSVKLSDVPMVIFLAVSLCLLNFLHNYFSCVLFGDNPLENGSRHIIYTAYGEYVIIPTVLSIISIVFFGPIIEEVLFRLFFISRLMSKGLGRLISILVPGVIFGALHADFFSATIFGVVLGFLYVNTNSLSMPLLTHMIYNLMVVVSEFIWIEVNGSYMSFEMDSLSIEYILINASLFFVSTFILFYKFRLHKYILFNDK